MDDHYQTLVISKTANADEIKRAYRKLASKNHPDKGGSTATFQKIQTAYDTLSDPEKRQHYDNPHTHNPFGTNSPHGFGNFNFGGANFDDVFGQMFNQRQQPHQQQQKPVYRTSVPITLEQVYTGDKITLQLQTQSQVHAVNIEIPKNVPNHGQVRYDDLIPNSVLVVEFVVQPHLKFERRGIDLYAVHPISVLDLIVGTVFEFITINGKTLEVTVQPKTQPVVNLRIPREGMIDAHGNKGDQIILIKPVIPDIIDDEITQCILRYKNN